MTTADRRTKSLSIIIATRDRCESLAALIESLKNTRGFADIRPEIVVADNGSSDDTWLTLERESEEHPNGFHPFKATRPGKAAALNDAIRIASGEICAFLDDDVVVEPGWLEAVHRYFFDGRYSVAQGVVSLPPVASEDPEIAKLFRRFRTIPVCEKPRGTITVDSLNGSNMAIARSVFERVNGFHERLGPGMSGTSDDTELAQRILAANIEIGFMEEAIVYHNVERTRLTEAYFKLHHQRQGRSRFVYKQQSVWRVLIGLAQGLTAFGLYSLSGNERKKYRGKGRVYHYVEILRVKLQGNGARKQVRGMRTR